MWWLTFYYESHIQPLLYVCHDCYYTFKDHLHFLPGRQLGNSENVLVQGWAGALPAMQWK